jgi:hypothetical protein
VRQVVAHGLDVLDAPVTANAEAGTAPKTIATAMVATAATRAPLVRFMFVPPLGFPKLDRSDPPGKP